MTTEPAGLTGVARRGFLWQALAGISGRVLVLVSTVVLARVLAPAEYGIVTLALVVIVHVSIFCDLGVSQALVYLPSRVHRTTAALVCALSGSTFLAVALAVLAGPITEALGISQGRVMLQVLTVSLVLTALGHVPDALLRQSLQFKKRLPAELARGLGRGVVTIGLALTGSGPWALVWGEIVGAAAFALVSWIQVAPRPHLSVLGLRWSEIRPLLAFGLPTALNGLLATLVQSVDYFVISSILGAAALGWYFVGFRLPELLIVGVFQVFSQVAYPMYTKVREDAEQLRRASLKSLRLQATYGIAVGAGLIAVSPLAVPVIFGARWQPSAAVMQAIALYMVFRSLSVGAVDIFKAVGRPNLGLRLSVGRLIILVPVLILATRWGIVGVAWAQAVLALVFAVVTQHVTCQVTGATWRDVARTLAPAMVVGVTVFGSALLGGYAIPASDAWNLVWACVLGGMGAVLAVALTDRQVLWRMAFG